MENKIPKVVWDERGKRGTFSQTVFRISCGDVIRKYILSNDNDEGRLRRKEAALQKSMNDGEFCGEVGLYNAVFVQNVGEGFDIDNRYINRSSNDAGNGIE